MPKIHHHRPRGTKIQKLKSLLIKINPNPNKLMYLYNLVNQAQGYKRTIIKR